MSASSKTPPAKKTKKQSAIPLTALALVGGGAALLYGLAKSAPTARRYLGPPGDRPTYARPGHAMTTATPAEVNAPESAKPAPKAKPIDSADPKPTPGFIGALKEIYYEFSNDDVMTQAAALAFYSGLAFAPLLTVAVWAARVFFGDDSKAKVGSAFAQVIGGKAAAPLQDLLKTGSNDASSGMTIAGLISIALVAFSASGVFGQVQSALNAIWHVAAKPSSGVMGFVRKRVLSLGMLMSILFLLLTSLILSTILQGILGKHDDDATLVWSIVQNAVSLPLFMALFALLFKFVPDAKIDWKPVWIGGLISAALFLAGKIGLSIYLGKGSYENAYGAAVGSFVALLVWVYYSAVILLIGAEATEVYARRHGHALEPDDHAVRVVQKTEEA